MNEELFLKEQNEKFWELSIRFLKVYVIEGSRWLKLYEDEGIEAGKINGHIAFFFRKLLLNYMTRKQNFQLCFEQAEEKSGTFCSNNFLALIE
ncbi:MAG: hypothetical protein IJV92_08895 [Phascolarctobacterium sp.]|nr:hypothetical protein [Phascolarctobacterium sp.]